MSEILVFPRGQFSDLPEKGVWPLDGLPTEYHWRERIVVEDDEAWLQAIPYLLIRNASGHLWSYQRVGGDARLHDRCSCGVGGHVERADERTELVDTLAAACVREASEELLDSGPLRMSEPQALLYEGLSAIGRVHIGIIYLADWLDIKEPTVAPGETLDAMGFLSPETIVSDDRFELWSRLSAACLQGPSPT